MKITTKRIRVITMTPEEHTKFLECMEAARQGHTSHYAESKLEDGSFLGVSIEKESPGIERDFGRKTKY